MNYVVIDYHKKYRFVTAIDEKGHVIRTTRLDNSAEPFQAFFSKPIGSGIYIGITPSLAPDC